MKLLIITAVAGIFLNASGAQAQTTTQYGIMRETQEIAIRSLDTLQKLTKANSKAMGFKSADEAAKSKIGDGLAVFVIGLDDLRKYTPGTDPNKLLVAADQVIYPVMVNDQPRSFVTVEKTREKWEATSFGGSNLIKAIIDARSAVVAAGAPADNLFVARVPGLNRYLIGFRTGDKLMLAPIMDDASLKFSAGKAQPGEEVLAALVPAAQRYNGLPL
jgi:hypothetical protein